MSLLLGVLPWACAEPAHAEPGGDAALERELHALREEVERQSAELAALRDARPEPDGAPTLEAGVGDDDDGRVGYGEPIVVNLGEEVDEVVSFGNDVDVAGRVLGDAISFGGNVRIQSTGEVEGDAVSFGGRVEVADGGKLLGDRVAMGMPASLAAPIPATESPWAGNLHLATDARAMLQSLYRRLVWMLSVAGAGVMVVGLFPSRVSRVALDLETRPVRAAVVGTLATGFLTVFAALFAVVTLGLGSPISLVLLAVLGIAWLLGFVGLCQAVGDRLPVQERPHGRWIAFLIGVCLITFLGSLPWVGWVVVGGASMVGIGAALSTRFGRATV
ncbi:MAG: hypothetical protein ABMB14_05805 [Myxococcota bacterium]